MPTLTEEQIRLIARAARAELGDSATFERLREVVADVVRTMEAQGPAGVPPEVRPRHLVICLAPDAAANDRTLSEALQGGAGTIGDRFARLLGSTHVLLAAVEGGDPAELRRRLAAAGNPLGVRVIVQPEEALRRGK